MICMQNVFEHLVGLGVEGADDGAFFAKVFQHQACELDRPLLVFDDVRCREFGLTTNSGDFR